MRTILVLLYLALFTSTASADEERRWLVPGEAFEPLAADPRWPRFEIGYERVIDSDTPIFDTIYRDWWTVSFGENVAIYTGPPPAGMPLVNRLERFEIGIPAAVFATFDLAEQSEPLLNADYMGGLYASGRVGKWSLLTRVYHRSSHLGDEFLLRGPAMPRFNFGYESWDVLVSRDLSHGARAYFGGGWIFHEQGRRDYGDGIAQYGLEYAPGEAPLRPLVAVDLQHLQSLDWQADLSVRLGVRTGYDDAGRFDFALTYYEGRNPNGQFYSDDLRSFGFLASFNF